MTTQNKEIVLGDVVKWELPHELCREKRVVSRDLTGTGLAVGECCEPDSAVAQVHTITALVGAPDPDSGTFKLGYKGQWTAAQAFDETVGNLKTAFEALSTVTDTITFGAQIDTLGASAITVTWGTAGPKDEIEIDGRLMLDGAVTMGVAGVTEPTFLVTTIGSTVPAMVVIATGANATGILLEKVTQAEIRAGNNIERAFLVKGDAIVNSDELTVLAAQKTNALTALVALGITMRTEPTIYQSGPPTS